MAHRQVAALTQMMDAVNAGDAAGYARVYAPDAVITIHGSGELRGRAAIEQYEVALLRQFPGARFAFFAVWQQGPSAVAHYAVNAATPRGPMGHEGLLFYRFLPSGLIAEERRYLDSMTPMAQMGLLGPSPARAVPALPAALHAYAANGSRAESENVATVTASLAALDAKDMAAFLRRVADDAVLDELTDPQPHIGKRAVQDWLETWTRAVPDTRSEITSILGAGDFVLVETIMRGTLQRPLGRLAAADKPFAVHRAAIFQLRGEKLARIACFMNGKELAEAVCQWPPRSGSG
ncbi:MAG TPA: nuclear transport factor 2 family protein, partial [Planctomycetota bacterium]|nr:nuclear transport factor 2 family protein [Planctomycetota bacterium]